MTLAEGPTDIAGADPLAVELAGVYGRMVMFYRDQFEMSGPAGLTTHRTKRPRTWRASAPARPTRSPGST